MVKKRIINDDLLNELEDYFFQFTVPPKDAQGGSRGMVLFGPPGTGKTELTEALPDIIGFHLIEKGLSAADFSKSLVGESSRMIKEMTYRAKLPHLLCSIGIDEVDGLVPDILNGSLLREGADGWTGWEEMYDWYIDIHDSSNSVD